ncbi:MAG TPA: shikimate kinase [Chloroflexota bacterium]|nr:shikimate kinase [Chloroflexota bacterium]
MPRRESRGDLCGRPDRTPVTPRRIDVDAVEGDQRLAASVPPDRRLALTPRRVAVVGTSGAGKTTFAAALAQRLGCRYVELDALHWEAGWRMAEPEVFRARVEQETAGGRWVVDGSYSKVRDLVWARADTLVWLDYPLAVKLWQLLERTTRRLWTGEELWNGNRERLSDHLNLLDRDNLFVWTIRQHRFHQITYPAALAEPAYAHLRLVRLRTPGAGRRWLEQVARDQANVDRR